MALGSDVITINLWYWRLKEGVREDSPYIHERVCVMLVKGDKRARWLAIHAAMESEQRFVLLRTKAMCTNCAIKQAIMN